MSTPYDGKILLVNWKAQNTPGNTIADLAQIIRQKMPNVSGLILKTSNGVSWQGHLSDEGAQAVTGVQRIQEWVDEFDKHGLEIHVWGVPRAKRAAGAAKSTDLPKEADKFISAAMVPGVKSLLLDVEHGEFYWQGNTAEVKELMQQIRAGVGQETHIGLILDPRRNRPFEFWVDPWIPFIDSLHPMVYPILFGRFQTIEKHMADAFQNLGTYNRAIVPMLQAFGEFGDRPAPEEVTQQGNIAWTMGAAGISYYRLSSDNWSHDKKPHMGEPEYQAIAAVATKKSSARNRTPRRRSSATHGRTSLMPPSLSHWKRIKTGLTGLPREAFGRHLTMPRVNSRTAVRPSRIGRLTWSGARRCWLC
ncbi:MAG: hypothetical protein R6X34_04485 [Chloroflexota bacterium]